MPLRALRSFLLSLLFTIILTPPLAFAQLPSDAELTAINNRVIELYRAGKYGEAIPLAKQYAAAKGARYGENAPEYATALNNLAMLLETTNRLSQAEPLYRRALEIMESNLGPDHPRVAVNLSNLAQLLQAMNRFFEAEPLLRRALAINEKSLGNADPAVARDLNNLALLLMETNRSSEAEPLYRRALAINEKSLGPDHTEVAKVLNNLSNLLQLTNRHSEAEPLMRRALSIFERSFGPDHPNVALSLSTLAQLLQDTNRLSEAEQLMRRAVAIAEKSHGPDHPNVAKALNNLAMLLDAANRPAEAEPLMRRVLTIFEKSFGPDHSNVAAALNNLAMLLKATNRASESESLYRRALAIYEKRLGPDHPDVAKAINNLAALLQATNRLSEAEPLMRRALTIVEKSFGANHPDVARSLNNLARLLQDMERHPEAEPLMLRALTIYEKSFGANHPNVARAMENLATVYQDQGRWDKSVLLFRKAKPNMTGVHIGGGQDRSRVLKAVLAQNTSVLRAYTRALYRVGASDAVNRAEGFETAQWALQNEAGDALSAMSARFAEGDRELGKLVREEQDTLEARKVLYQGLDVAAAKSNAKLAETLRALIVMYEGELAEKQAALRRSFPDYAELANPKPLSLVETQALLGDGDALVLFLDLWQIGRVPGETVIFAVTKKEARWASVSLDSGALRDRVVALRCGLDTGAWSEAVRQKCRDITGREPGYYPWGDAIAETLPFGAAAAHALYRDLFGGIEDLIAGKSLLIVPSGALTQLPFEVLVTEEPDERLPRFEAFKSAAWLGERQAITVLPSVSSLKALRAAKASAAPETFVGFGNPLLTGADGRDKRAWAKQRCSEPLPSKPSRIASLTASVGSLFRGGAVDVEKLRRQPPLPETADELCAAGRALGVSEAGLPKAIYLGERATVSNVKALSRSGNLAQARVVHFATHGLLAGETAMFAKNNAEPALLLTPPAKVSGEDNGLLTASEVAQLDLNADWVVMSACNTAAGSAESAEALSGLARAFFYAGARSLLVSHWYVDSEAAVAITTGAVNAMKAEPGIGRTEALRRAEAALIARGGRFAHPSVWGPFVLVGNGEQLN
ncbi:MAG: tetratricopeptide repeat protein [Rhodomicrobium sp.]